jgi:hypothetical protein
MLVMLLSSQTVIAATPIWSNQYDAHADMSIQDMHKTANGFITAGQVCLPPSENVCDNHLMVAKLNAQGRVSWSKAYPGFTGLQPWYGKGSIIQSAADGYVLVGQTMSDGLLAVRVIKLDMQGEVQWVKVYKGASPTFANDILVVDNGFVVVGSRGDYRSAARDAWVVSLDLEGNVVWEKTLGTTTGQEAARLIQMHAGGYIIVADAFPNVGIPESSIWLMKLNPSNGSVLWQKAYAAPGAQYLKLRTMHAGSQGLVVAGSISDYGYKAFTISLNHTGAIQWQHYYHDPAHVFPTLASIKALDAGYIAAGRQENYGDAANQQLAWVLKLNADGTIVWERAHAIDRSPNVFAIEPHDGGFVLGGTTYTDSEWSRQQGFVSRLNSQGDMPGCEFPEHASQSEVESAHFAVDADGIEHQVGLKPAIDIVTEAITATSFNAVQIEKCPPSYGPLGSASRHCEAVLNRRVCELLRFGEFSLSVDEQYLACPPACGFSIDERSPSVPGEALDIYTQMHELLGKTQLKEVSPKYFDHLASVLNKSIIRPRGTVDKSIAALKGAKKLPPKLFEQLAKSANEMALDLAVPKLSPVKVGKGKYSAVDFNGVAWLAFREVSKAGRASLKMIPGLPAKTTKYKAGWPVSYYQFGFTGSLGGGGYIDVNLYIGGVNHAGPLSELRMLEWDGKTYRDITTNVDKQRGIISGRTKKLHKLVVLSLLRSQQAVQGRK